MYYVCVYNRKLGGTREQRLEAETKEQAELLRKSLEHQDRDVIIEDHSHPVEYHEVGVHGDYTIGTAEGVVGAWPSAGNRFDFRPAEELEPELRAACEKYSSV